MGTLTLEQTSWKSAVRFGARGSWAGAIVAALVGMLIILVLFVWGMSTGAPIGTLGMEMQPQPNGAFQFEIDVRPITALTIGGMVLGTLAGAFYGMRKARRR